MPKNKEINELERVWSVEKYYVLSKSQKIYKEIRELLKNKDNPDVEGFYLLLKKAREEPVNRGNFINSMQHIYGYFKDKVNPNEKDEYQKLYDNKDLATDEWIEFFRKLQKKYKSKYLENQSILKTESYG